MWLHLPDEIDDLRYACPPTMRKFQIFFILKDQPWPLPGPFPKKNSTELTENPYDLAGYQVFPPTNKTF
ncbi:hypothetical protein [Methanospirillum sp.]|uniref:hypothetical protein n=1 Tax=Methanospirillum sp. TaxID=45200 RepID=UPI0035A0D41B